jgi:aspartyl-tRNA(Asn)/glutamyl-tRNA(Gln) amidotransferase subunit A
MSALGEDVLYQTVSELAPQIRSRNLSPVDLTEAYLERIRMYGPRLNAFQTVTADLAREEARRAEKEIESGTYRGPLHGIPYGAKDLLATKDIPTSWGARPSRDQVFDHDAAVITRLRDAGAILLGKLAMVEFAGGLGYRYANASVSGPGRNPWDPDRWTGGSSSGTGAAVAAALVAFGIGTETWGSILCPSAFCGVTGLRPTFGRVSRAGAMVLSWTYDKIGPMCRSAADCRLVLSAIAGHDPADPHTTTEPADFASASDVSVSKLRAALIPMDFSKGEPEVKEAFDRAVSELRAAGLRIEETKLPEFPTSEIAGLLITVEALSSFENFYRDGRVRQMVDEYAPYQKDINAAITGTDVMKAWRMRAVIQEKMAGFFSRYDVIVTPNFLSVAPPVSEDLNKALPYGDPAGAIGNTCGLPSIALPCGFGTHNMPVGFQIMGSPYEEATLLDLGELYQRRTRFHREHPSLA